MGTGVTGYKAERKEGDHLPRPSSGFEIAWSYTSSSPLGFIAWCLIQLGSKFTLPFTYMYFSSVVRNKSTRETIKCFDTFWFDSYWFFV